MSDKSNPKPDPESPSLALIGKHLGHILDELAVITAEIEEMKARRTNAANGDHEKP